MKILQIAHCFPPFNTMGAVRAGKFSKYLVQMGHEVRVLSAAPQALQKTLPLEILASHVTYTRWLDVAAPTYLVLGGRDAVASSGTTQSSASVRKLFSGLSRVYKTLVYTPDSQIGWLPFLIRSGTRIIRSWRPDIIFATATPHSALIGAHVLSRRSGIPWIAEFRDLWIDDTYYEYPAWRRRIERRMERCTLSSARGLVTVSEPWADILRAHYGKPTCVVTNGYDPADYPLRTPETDADNLLHIVYTGNLIQEKRDPRPLFAAIAALGNERRSVRVSFYGRQLHGVRAIAQQYGISDNVEVCDQLPYLAALERQVRADVLLLLVWDDPREQGFYSGKLFEYIGAGRPILAIGRSDNAAIRLITERKFGVTAREPELIKELLLMWIREKRANGSITAAESSSRAEFTRANQFRALEQFLRELAS